MKIHETLNSVLLVIIYLLTQMRGEYERFISSPLHRLQRAVNHVLPVTLLYLL